jgi:hypothetical protein
VTQQRGLRGARREASERVQLRSENFEAEAWSLNVSRGGMRIVIETPLAIGLGYELVLPSGEARKVRVVWLREEPDGQIAGLEFEDGPFDKTPLAPSVK